MVLLLTGFTYAFAKYQWNKIDSRSVPYDYKSIMHYGAKDFSRNGSATIRSLDPTVKEFGNDHLSPLDIKQANLMYNCSGKFNTVLDREDNTCLHVDTNFITKTQLEFE